MQLSQIRMSATGHLLLVRKSHSYVDADLDMADILHQIAWYKSQNMVKPEVMDNES